MNNRIGTLYPILRSCGNISVSIPKIKQQARYINMQKIYFDNTMFFRENGKAHNKVEAFGYCVSFKDTYCKSMKIEKIVISTNPSIPAYSGEPVEIHCTGKSKTSRILLLAPKDKYIK